MTTTSLLRRPADQQFRVTLLGASGVGKTSFLAAMNEAFAKPSGATCQFSLRVDDTHAARLDGVWRQLRDQGARSSIAGTSGNTHYGFQVLHDGHPVAGMEWMDYRGGIVDERTAGGMADAAEFHAVLARTHVLFVMMEAREVMDGAGSGRQVRHLARLLRETVANAPGLLGVQLLVTKAEDWLASPDRERALLERTRSSMDRLAGFLEQTDRPFGIIPVSSLGSGSRERRPIHVRRPMIVAFECWLAQAIKDAQAGITAINQEISRLQQEAVRCQQMADRNASDWSILFPFKEIACEVLGLESDYKLALQEKQKALAAAEASRQDLLRREQDLGRLHRAVDDLRRKESAGVLGWLKDSAKRAMRAVAIWN